MGRLVNRKGKQVNYRREEEKVTPIEEWKECFECGEDFYAGIIGQGWSGLCAKCFVKRCQEAERKTCSVYQTKKL